MNTTYKKCYIKPWNVPNREEQENMIEKIEMIKKECEIDNSILLFSDAVHQLHTTNNWYAVQFKGKEYTKILSSNTWRKRFTIVWAVNPYTCKTSFVTTDWMCNKDLIKWLIDKICKDYKEAIFQNKNIYLILDNARYQKAKDVQEYANNMGINLCFLPPYCPHLNIIERLRKRLKKKLRNRYIALFLDFCNIISDIISSTQNSFSELKTLLALNFGII